MREDLKQVHEDHDGPANGPDPHVFEVADGTTCVSAHWEWHPQFVRENYGALIKAAAVCAAGLVVGVKLILESRPPTSEAAVRTATCPVDRSREAERYMGPHFLDVEGTEAIQPRPDNRGMVILANHLRVEGVTGDGDVYARAELLPVRPGSSALLARWASPLWARVRVFSGAVPAIVRSVAGDVYRRLFRSSGVVCVAVSLLGLAGVAAALASRWCLVPICHIQSSDDDVRPDANRLQNLRHNPVYWECDLQLRVFGKKVYSRWVCFDFELSTQMSAPAITMMSAKDVLVSMMGAARRYHQLNADRTAELYFGQDPVANTVGITNQLVMEHRWELNREVFVP